MQATDAAVFSGLSDGEASGGAEQRIVRQLALVQSGEALDTAAYRMTAEIAVTDAVLQPLPGQLDALDEAAPEAETGVTLAVMQAGDEGLQELDSATISAGEAAPVFTVSVQSGTIAVLATTANPSYTVQYYAYIPRFAVSGGKTLNVYNTEGKNLPKNGKSNAQKQIFLTPAEGTTMKNAGTATQNYKVATTDELTQMYTANKFEYIKATNPSYINIISNESWYETPLLTSILSISVSRSFPPLRKLISIIRFPLSATTMPPISVGSQTLMAAMLRPRILPNRSICSIYSRIMVSAASQFKIRLSNRIWL